MAREIPYFQFEPAQYLTGNIQFCSLEEQGAFINICSIYWQRSCKLSKEQIIRKYDSNIIHRLISEDVLKCGDNDEIVIEFLDEQWETITNSKIRLSEAGRKGALKKKEATLKPPLSEASPTLKQLDKIIEDERKVDKIIEEKKKEDNKIISRDSIAPKKTIEERENDFMNSIAPYVSEYGKEMCRKFYEHWTEKNQGGTKMKFEMQKTWEVGKRLKTWFDNSKNFNNGNKTKRNGQPDVDKAMALADGILSGEINPDVLANIKF